MWFEGAWFTLYIIPLLVIQTSDKNISKYIMLVFIFTMPSFWLFRCKLHTCLASQRAGIGHHFLLGLGETCNKKVRPSRFQELLQLPMLRDPVFGFSSNPLRSVRIILHNDKMTLVRLALPIEPPFWRSTVASQLRAGCGGPPSWKSHQRSREGRVSMRSFQIFQIFNLFLPLPFLHRCYTHPGNKPGTV